MLFISWTLCQIDLFEFIRVEEGVKFMKHLRGGTSRKSSGTCGVPLNFLSTFFCECSVNLWNFKFSRRRVWSSELSSGMYCIIPDDGGSTYLWNVGRQLFYTAVHPRRQFWTSVNLTDRHCRYFLLQSSTVLACKHVAYHIDTEVLIWKKDMHKLTF
jgi:hypothetical protein